MDFDASAGQQMADSFQKYYGVGNRKNRSKSHMAYQIRGQKVAENRIKVIEGILPAAHVLKEARGRETTVTVLLAAILTAAIGEEMNVRDRKRPVVLNIPVNLRKYFASASARNFFGLVSVHYPFGERSGELEDIVTYLGECFRKELTTERLEGRMNSLGALEHNIVARVIPLFIKNIGMRIAFELSTLSDTAALSNLGRVDMPSPMREYIRLFDVFCSTEKLQICMCSFEENMVVSFSSSYVDTDIPMHFFRTLTAMGIPVEIVDNPID